MPIKFIKQNIGNNDGVIKKMNKKKIEKCHIYLN